MKYPVIVFAVLMMAVSCKTSKETVTTSTEATLTVPKKGDKPVSSVNRPIYPLYISFFSRSSGIDHKVKEEYDKFILQFESDNKLKLKVEIIKWGREGEIDMCFMLSDISKKKQKDFILKSKEILGKSDTVYIYEDAVCARQK